MHSIIMLCAPSWPWHTSAWSSPSCSDLTESNGSDLIEGDGSDLSDGNGRRAVCMHRPWPVVPILWYVCVCVPQMLCFSWPWFVVLLYMKLAEIPTMTLSLSGQRREPSQNPVVNRIHHPLHKIIDLSPWSKRPGIHTPLGCRIQRCGLS